MTRSALELEVDGLRAQLDVLAERVRVDTVAEAFIAGSHEIREGDYFLLDGFPTKLGSVSSEGKWTYFNGSNCVEPFRVPEPDEYDRLYTIAEVAEIVAKARRGLS